MPQNACKMHHYEGENQKKNSGEGCAPSPDPSPLGRGCWTNFANRTLLLRSLFTACTPSLLSSDGTCQMGLIWCMGVILAGCSSWPCQWLIRMSAGIESKFSGWQFSGWQSTELRLLLATALRNSALILLFKIWSTVSCCTVTAFALSYNQNKF